MGSVTPDKRFIVSMLNQRTGDYQLYANQTSTPKSFSLIRHTTRSLARMVAGAAAVRRSLFGEPRHRRLHHHRRKQQQHGRGGDDSLIPLPVQPCLCRVRLAVPIAPSVARLRVTIGLEMV